MSKAKVSKTIQSDLLLLLVAAIWGFAFVAQREGAGFIPPLAFVAIRYVLGALSLLPIVFVMDRKKKLAIGSEPLAAKAEQRRLWMGALPGGLAMGATLFVASLLQQTALEQASAGQAGFITSLYVVLVPVIGIVMKRYKPRAMSFVTLALAMIGLYLLSVQGRFEISRTDFILIISAFLYSLHIILIDHFSSRTDPVRLSTLQFALAGVLGLIGSLLFRVNVKLDNLLTAALPLLYTGIFSSGVAYTLQIFAQRHTPASHAAIIMSMESVFAAVGGVLFLNEAMSGRAVLGALLMLVSGILSQLSSLPSAGYLQEED